MSRTRTTICSLLFIGVLALVSIIFPPKTEEQIEETAITQTEVQTEAEIKASGVIHTKDSFDAPGIYDVPLTVELQLHIINECKKYNIEPTIVIAIIEQESNYDASAIGDNGDSLGLMQIQPMWHQERMERLGCLNLLDPYQNVTVGIDILAEILEEYKDIEKALVVYNAGPSKANKWFNKGICETTYSNGVLERYERLEETNR